MSLSFGDAALTHLKGRSSQSRVLTPLHLSLREDEIMEECIGFE